MFEFDNNWHSLSSLNVIPQVVSQRRVFFSRFDDMTSREFNKVAPKYEQFCFVWNRIDKNHYTMNGLPSETKKLEFSLKALNLPHTSPALYWLS